MRRGAVLEEIDTLPGPKRQVAARNRNRERGLGKRRFDVRRHVVRSFFAMPKPRRLLWHEPAEKFLKIAPDIGIGGLLNEERGRGMTDEKCELPKCDSAVTHELASGNRHLVEPSPLCGDDNLTLPLTHGGNPNGRSGVILYWHEENMNGKAPDQTQDLGRRRRRRPRPCDAQ